ncbi:MAG: IS66 family transposase [Bacteroidales bacterium]
MSQLTEKDNLICELTLRIDALMQNIQSMDQRIATLVNAQFGTKSEKLKKKPSASREDQDMPGLNFDNGQDQLLLPQEFESETPAKNDSVNSKSNVKTGSLEFDGIDNMQQVIHNIFPKEDYSNARLLRVEDVKIIRYIPGYFVEEIYRNHIYADKERILSGQIPEIRTLERCKADSSVLSMILTAKYRFHLPLERQLHLFRTMGYNIPKSTLNNWTIKACRSLEPLYEQLKKTVLDSDYLGGDETIMNVLEKGKEKVRKDYVWGFKNRAVKMMFFLYQHGSRSQKVLFDLLDNFNGAFQADAFSAYRNLEKPPFNQRIIRLSCAAHIRRKFFDIKDKEPRAMKALAYIGDLYLIEKYCREQNFTPIQTCEYRNQHATPILNQFKEWLEYMANLNEVLPKSALGKAIVYARKEFDALCNYLKDGRYAIDNNELEQLMRGPVVGRKNYMFCGSENGAECAAIIYSFVESCKLNGIDPFAYLDDILKRLPDTKKSNLRELLPDKWKDQTKI